MDAVVTICRECDPEKARQLDEAATSRKTVELRCAFCKRFMEMWRVLDGDEDSGD